MERKQYKSSWNPFYQLSADYWVHTIQRVNEMAETKLAVIILNLLGIPFVGFVLFVAPINFIQATVVWALVVIFLTARIYFYIKWGIQKTRNNELDIIERENNLIKKIDTDED